MSYTVEIDYGSGWEDLTEITRHAGFSRTQNVHNKDHKPVIGTAEFDIDLDTTLANTLLTMDPHEPVLCRIQKDAADWFVGYIRPVTDFRVNPGAKTISFQAVDTLYILKRKIDALIQKVPADNMVVCRAAGGATSLVHAILSAAGFTATVNGVDILNSIESFRAEPEKTDYFTILTDLLYSYHRSFYADASGGFRIYDWGPSTVTPAGTFNSGNIRGELVVTRDDAKEEDSVAVEWYRVSTERNVQIVSGDGGYGLVEPTAPGFEYPPKYTDAYLEKYWDWSLGETGEKKVLSVTPAGAAYFIKSENPRVIGAPLWRDINLWTSTSYSGAGLATFTILDLTHDAANARTVFYGTGVSVRVGAFKVTASVVYKIKQATVYYPSTGRNKVKNISGEYLYSLAAAEELTAAYYKTMSDGAYRYTFRSLVSVPAGGYYTLENAALNISTTVRIVKKTTEHVRGTEIYYYEAEGASAIGAIVTEVVGGTFAITDDSPGVSSGASAANEGLTPTGKVVQSIESNILDDLTPSKTGLFLTATRLGFYVYDEVGESGEWTVFIKNDGSFLFQGDDDNYIEWDGSDLIIQGTARSSNYSAGTAGWQIDVNGDAEFNDVTVRGTVEAAAGNIGAWVIDDPDIRDTDERVFLRSSEKRLEVRDSIGTIKAALGYLDGIGAYGENDYGLYIADGNEVVIDGGGEFLNGDFFVQHDAAFVMLDSGDNEVVRLGSISGDVGIRIGNISTGQGLQYLLSTDELIVKGTVTTEKVQVADTEVIVADTAGAGALRSYLERDKFVLEEHDGAEWIKKGSLSYEEPDTTNLSIQYDFDDDLTDSSGNGEDAIETGTVTYDTGPYGKSVLVGDSNHFAIPGAAGRFFCGASNSWTAAFWMKKGTNLIVKKKDTSIFYLQAVGTDVYKTLNIYLRGTLVYASNGVIALEQWYFVYMTWDGTTFKLYLNANPLFSGTTVGAGADDTDEPIVFYGAGDLPTYPQEEFAHLKYYDDWAGNHGHCILLYRNYKQNNYSHLSVNSITLTAPGSPFYSPVAGEPSVGTGHWKGGAVPASWDISARIEAYTSPYVWNLDGLLPVGATSVVILAALLINTASQTQYEQLLGWDFDYGSTFNQYKTQMHGIYLTLPAIPATSGSQLRMVSGEFTVKIGPSRKLYIGRVSGAALMYAMVKRNEA